MTTSRRDFIRLTTAGSGAAVVAPALAGSAFAAQMPVPPRATVPGGTPKKAILLSMLPRDLSYEARFALAREVGFEARMDRKASTYAFVHLGEGDIDWPEVRKALHEGGYDGYVTPEIRGGDKAYLVDVAARIDRILAGERPIAS